MLVRESISFQRGRDPKEALGLNPYDGVILKIPHGYVKTQKNTLYYTYKFSTGYELWKVVKAEQKNDMIMVDLEHKYNRNNIKDVLLTYKQFEKFRDI